MTKNLISFLYMLPIVKHIRELRAIKKATLNLQLLGLNMEAIQHMVNYVSSIQEDLIKVGQTDPESIGYYVMKKKATLFDKVIKAWYLNMRVSKDQQEFIDIVEDIMNEL